MANKDDKGRFWPYMILGFLAIGIILGYWTVKHAIGMPVHESNEYMMKYQKADQAANEILEAQRRFDRRYTLRLEGMKLSDFKPEHLKRKAGPIVALGPVNTVSYRVTDKAGQAVNDANVSLLVTRPHTEKEDQYFKNVPGKNGLYTVENIKIKNPGRYILRIRVQKGDAIGFQDTEGYLKPDK